MAERDERLIARIKEGIVACLEEDDSSYFELFALYDRIGGESIYLPFIQAWFDLLSEGRIVGDIDHVALVKTHHEGEVNDR